MSLTEVETSTWSGAPPIDRTSGLRVVQLTRNIGAEITGIDLRRPLPPDVLASLVAALHRHHVLFFPQPVTPAEHIAVGRQFGELTEAHVAMPALVEGYPEIFSSAEVTRAMGLDQRRYESNWHSDLSYLERPPGINVLNLIEVPDAGGDTLWASTQAAYDNLSEPIRRLVDELTAVHDGASLQWCINRFGPQVWEGQLVERLGEQTHPVVAVDPVTGRRGLYLNPGATTRINELGKAESKALLALLYDHITRDEHVVRYRWPRPHGGLAVWKNQATLHAVVPDATIEHRISHRVMTRGGRPAAVNGADGTA